MYKLYRKHKKFLNFLLGLLFAIYFAIGPTVNQIAEAYLDVNFGRNPTISLSLVNRQAINIHHENNGGTVNTHANNPSDPDQKIQFDSLGNDCGYLRKAGTDVVISVKGSDPDQLLETWQKVQNAWQQQWCMVKTKQPGRYVIALKKDPNLVIGVPNAKNFSKLILERKNGHPYQYWYISQIFNGTSRTSTPDPVVKTNRKELLTGNCRSNTQFCLPEGYNGRSDTWGFGEHGIDNDGTTHNCTAFAAWWLSKHGQARPGVNLGNANTWGVNAKSAGLDVRTSPVVGSVGVLESSGFGHVFVVSSLEPDNEMWIMEDNFSWTRGWSSRRRVSRTLGTKYIVPPAFR